MNKMSYTDAVPYVTRDGSVIRELMHPSMHAVRNQSLAEAVVKPGQITLRHRHLRTEELYHITEGKGCMWLGDCSFEVVPGDTVLIPPGTVHSIENIGEGVLKLLCCCSPPYSHDDTEVLD